MNTDINYTANNGTKKTLYRVVTTSDDKFYHRDKHYQIDRTGQYPLLQVHCMGKCNTYWRTIGRYPEVDTYNLVDRLRSGGAA